VAWRDSQTTKDRWSCLQRPREGDPGLLLETQPVVAPKTEASGFVDSWRTAMESISFLHCLIFILIAAMLLINGLSPMLGVIRGVRNASVLHSLLSVMPFYGLAYFILGRRVSRL
jgi:hypothetical protein